MIELVLPLDAARLQQGLEQLGRGGAAPALEQRRRAGQHRLEGRADHRPEYIRQRFHGRVVPGAPSPVISWRDRRARPRRRPPAPCGCARSATPTPDRCAPATKTRCVSTARSGLFAVADGMGGHRAGEVASHLAIEALVDQVTASRRPGFAWPYGLDPARDDAANELDHAVRAANARVVEAGERDPDLSGMGTTLTALAMGAGHVAIASVGDSRGYLVRDGAVRQLTHDDTWLVSVLGRDAARARPRRAPIRCATCSRASSARATAPRPRCCRTTPGRATCSC